MDQGYIKLYRKILDNPIVRKDKDHFIVFIYLLLMASHTERKIIFGSNSRILNPGQLVTGLKKISDDCEVEIHKVDRILKLFKNEKQIEIETNTKGTLITVKNWHLYQSIEKQNEKQMRTNKNVRSYYYNYLEIIYARTISYVEIEKLNYLLDIYPEELVKASLDNSALMNAKNLKYVEQTLKNWKSEGITKVNELYKKEERNEEEPVELFDYDWLGDNGR